MKFMRNGVFFRRFGAEYSGELQVSPSKFSVVKTKFLTSRQMFLQSHPSLSAGAIFVFAICCKSMQCRENNKQYLYFAKIYKKKERQKR